MQICLLGCVVERVCPCWPVPEAIFLWGLLVDAVTACLSVFGSASLLVRRDMHQCVPLTSMRRVLRGAAASSGVFQDDLPPPDLACYGFAAPLPGGVVADFSILGHCPVLVQQQPGADIIGAW